MIACWQQFVSVDFSEVFHSEDKYARTRPLFSLACDALAMHSLIDGSRKDNERKRQSMKYRLLYFRSHAIDEVTRRCRLAHASMTCELVFKGIIEHRLFALLLIYFADRRKDQLTLTSD